MTRPHDADAWTPAVAAAADRWRFGLDDDLTEEDADEPSGTDEAWERATGPDDDTDYGLDDIGEGL